MAKDKKKKKNKKGASAGSTAATSLRAMTKNPLVADVVAAALVATAAAIKDSRKARQLAAEAGEELETLAKEGAERGSAMWQLALDIGRRALDTYVGEDAKPAKAAKRAAPRSRSKPAKTSKPAKGGAKGGRKAK